MNTIKVTNIAELKTRKGTPESNVEVLGYYTEGDGGGGSFYWDNTSSETDNGGTTLSVTNISTGRWKRIYDKEINVKWFGAKGDGITDNSTIFQSVINIQKAVFVPVGNYLISTSVILPNNCNIRGEGKSSRLMQSLTNPVNIFFINPATNNIDISYLNFDGRRKDEKIVIPFSKTRLNSLIQFDGGSLWCKNITISNCWFTEAIQFHLSLEQCDGIKINNLFIEGNGLDTYGLNYTGNCDGIHLNNCINAVISDCIINSGDDCIGITVDSAGLKGCQNININNIVGTSQEANGVIFNGESTATNLQFFRNINISNIKFSNNSSTVNFGDAVRFKVTGSEKINYVNISNISVGVAKSSILLSNISNANISNITSLKTVSHGVHIIGSNNCNVNNVISHSAGENSNFGICGILLDDSDNISITNAIIEESRYYGIQIESGNNNFIGNVKVINCGKGFTGIDKGGIRLNNSTNCVIGEGVYAISTDNVNQSYGLYMINSTNCIVASDLNNFNGYTYNVLNPAGADTSKGTQISAYISDNGIVANLVQNKNIASIIRNSWGDYTLTYQGNVFRPNDGTLFILTGSANNGINNNDFTVKVVDISLGSFRIKVTDGNGLLAQPTQVFVHIIATHYTF